MNQENRENLYSQLEEIAQLDDGWAGEYTHAPGLKIIERVKELIGLMEIPDTHEIQIEPTDYGTIEIEIRRDGWKMCIEVGISGANYYTVSGSGGYKTYENGSNSMQVLAENINKNQ